MKREPAGLDRQSRFPRGAPPCRSEIVDEKRAEDLFLTLAMDAMAHMLCQWNF
jgi:hypothetical protein